MLIFRVVMLASITGLCALDVVAESAPRAAQVVVTPAVSLQVGQGYGFLSGQAGGFAGKVPGDQQQTFRMQLAQKNTTCYAIRSYRFTREADSDALRHTGSSTCIDAALFGLKNAAVLPAPAHP